MDDKAGDFPLLLTTPTNPTMTNTTTIDLYAGKIKRTINWNQLSFRPQPQSPASSEPKCLDDFVDDKKSKIFPCCGKILLLTTLD